MANPFCDIREFLASFHLRIVSLIRIALSGYWDWKDIEAIARAGIVGGYADGGYHPDAAINRGQMAVFVSHALAGSDDAVPPGPATPTFSDVAASFWAYKHIEYVVAQRIAQGYADGTYGPGNVVTRDQMSIFM